MDGHAVGKPIGTLAGGIVAPQVRASADKGVRIGGDDNRGLHPGLCVGLVGEDRIDDRIIAQDIGHDALRVNIGRDVLVLRLIRDVEEKALVQLFFPQEGKQGGEVGTQKVRVGGVCNRGVPAEDALCLAADGGVNGRSAFGTPLGEEVGMLKMGDAAIQRQMQKPPQKRKIKFVFLAVLYHADKLYRHAVFANGGVKRRGETGGQQGVHAVRRRHADIGGVDIKEMIGKKRNAVEIAQAITVHPVDVKKIVARQASILHAQRNAGLANKFAVSAGKKPHTHGVFPGGDLAAAFVYRDPQGLEAIARRMRDGLFARFRQRRERFQFSPRRVDFLFKKRVGKKAGAFLFRQSLRFGMRQGTYPTS